MGVADTLPELEDAEFDEFKERFGHLMIDEFKNIEVDEK